MKKNWLLRVVFCMAVVLSGCGEFLDGTGSDETMPRYIVNSMAEAKEDTDEYVFETSTIPRETIALGGYSLPFAYTRTFTVTGPDYFAPVGFVAKQAIFCWMANDCDIPHSPHLFDVIDDLSDQKLVDIDGINFLFPLNNGERNYLISWITKYKNSKFVRKVEINRMIKGRAPNRGSAFNFIVTSIPKNCFSSEKDNSFLCDQSQEEIEKIKKEIKKEIKEYLERMAPRFVRTDNEINSFFSGTNFLEKEPMKIVMRKIDDHHAVSYFFDASGQLINSPTINVQF